VKINEQCDFFLRDIYLYDITACHYNILERLGLDVSHLDKSDKTKRNIQIGLMMRDNPSLTSILRDITESTIDEYLLRNKVAHSEVVIRQYDGIITTRRLNETTDRYMPLTLQRVFNIFVISIDRNRYLAHDGKEMVVKGVPHRYQEMDLFLEKLARLNFSSKTSVFKGMQRIKDEILTTKNALVFGIPTGENKYNIFLKNIGELEVSKGTLKIMDVEDIDRQRYFDFYLRPFTEAITMEFV